MGYLKMNEVQGKFRVVTEGSLEEVIDVYKRQVVMYVILVYDVDQKRTAKMLKLCRRYLSWIQNSVFAVSYTHLDVYKRQILF